MKGPLMLVKILDYAGYMGPFIDKYLSKLCYKETIELLIESIEPHTDRYEEYRIIYRPFNFVQRNVMDKRLNYLNLF